MMPGEDSLHAAPNPASGSIASALRVTVAGDPTTSPSWRHSGGSSAWAFPVPSVLLDDYLAAGDLVLLGHADRASIEYFAVSASRRLTHPCVVAVTREGEHQP
ncbi:MAG: hypothetical protein IPP18_00395 [Rhodocyclaceae bacterium]|nr:hypothetical protein [Rhodocyclaceae bacterium]